MTGPECSLIALCDGTTAVALPLAQDHKRIGEGDIGPNTGGMGAYAPAPVPYEADRVGGDVRPADPRSLRRRRHSVHRCAVRRADAHRRRPAPRRVQRPLRRSRGPGGAAAPRRRPGGDRPRRHPGSPRRRRRGDPSGLPPARSSPPPPAIRPTRALGDDGHAADRRAARRRAALPRRSRATAARAAAGCSPSPGSATTSAPPEPTPTQRSSRSSFAGMQYRRDIGWRAPGPTLASYAAAGVDIAEGNRAVAEMRHAVERTHGAEVVRGVGSFGGAFSAKAIAAMDDPVLVASTDGVGTKVELAAQLGRVRGLGHDIVNHCVGDVFVQSARPLFFLDYIAASKLDADLVAEMVSGMAEACAAAGCTLLGGETAEMPGVYTAWLVRHRRHPRRRRRARGAAPPSRRRRRRRADRRGVERPAHQRLLAAAQAVRLDPDGRHARRIRPAARRRPARAASQLPAGARSGGRHGRRQGARPHHRRRPSGERAAGPARRRRRRRSTSGRGPYRRCSGSSASWPRRSTTRAAPHAEHGHRHGRRLRARRRRGRAVSDRRGDLGDRRARRPRPAAGRVRLIRR